MTRAEYFQELNDKAKSDAMVRDAAPELLDALTSLRLQALQSGLNDPANEWGREAISKANAAIAKATGQ
jgi:hypothetical protein